MKPTMATGVLDLLMKKWFNKLAHVTIGAWVAGGVNDPRFRHGPMPWARRS